MRTTLIVLVALLIAAPVMAAREVSVTCETDGEDPGVVRIDYSFSGGVGEPNRVRAFALHVSVDAGIIDAVNDYKEGESSKHGTKGYGIFPGSIDLSNPQIPVWNDPVAPDTDRGAEGTGLGTDTVILEMGSLYAGGDANAPPASGTLCRLTVTENCWMTIDEEQSVRGGIVLEDPPGDPPDTTNLPSQCQIEVVQDCMMDTHPSHANWLYWNKPDCWCYKRQCRGDGDGVPLGPFWVSLNDLTAFRGCVGKIETLLPPGCECSDFDHQKLGPFWVSLNDLTIFRQYVGKLVGLIPECDGTHINFWTN